MKKTLFITLILFLCSKFLSAQNTYNYAGYSVGAGAGIARADADVAQHISKAAYLVNFNYNYTPFITFTAELQAGKLAGGNPQTDKDTRAFVNNYKGIVFYADFQAGEFIDYENRPVLNVLKNIYVGTGFGVFNNKLLYVQRTSLNNPGYVFPGQDASTEFGIPFRAGYEFKIYNYYHEPQIRVDVGIEETLVYGEGIDGYDDPPSKFRNNHVDRYSLVHVGLKYSFGFPISYKKPIRRF